MTCDCGTAGGIFVPFGSGYVKHTYDDLPAVTPAESGDDGNTADPLEATMAPAPASETTTLDALRTWLGDFGEELWSGVGAGRSAATSFGVMPLLLGTAIGLLLLILLTKERSRGGRP